MWSTYADKAQQSLVRCFWNSGISCFNHGYPLCDKTNSRLIYWWFAHAIDCLLDGYERTSDGKYLELADKTLDGVMVWNGNRIIHNWYDDMEWFGLALLRFYDITGKDKYIKLVDCLWEDIKTAWNPHCGGGLAWRKDQPDYKNTPANAPAAILAARLYQRFKKAEDLDWAKKIYRWNRENLMDRETGFIWDGMNREGDGKIDKDWEFTYCQGVMIGAALELHRILGEAQYASDAGRIYGATCSRLLDANGLFKDEGRDDAGLFKGILVRYLALMSRDCPDTGAGIRTLLIRNAQSMLEAASGDFLFGTGWTEKPSEDIQLSSHLSGVMLLEAAAGFGKM